MVRRVVETTSRGLAGGQTVQADLYRSAEGEADQLVISVGWSHEADWYSRAQRVVLPGEALEFLGEMLRELEAGK